MIKLMIILMPYIFINASAKAVTKTAGLSKTISSLKTFGLFRENAKKSHAASENKLLKYGEGYLKKHSFYAEKLSLSELLPQTVREFPKFCNSYLKSVADYYNLESRKQLSTIKSPNFKEFNKMVQKECFNKTI